MDKCVYFLALFARAGERSHNGHLNFPIYQSLLMENAQNSRHRWKQIKLPGIFDRGRPGFAGGFAHDFVHGLAFGGVEVAPALAGGGPCCGWCVSCWCRHVFLVC